MHRGGVGGRGDDPRRSGAIGRWSPPLQPEGRRCDSPRAGPRVAKPPGDKPALLGGWLTRLIDEIVDKPGLDSNHHLARVATDNLVHHSDHSLDLAPRGSDV